MSVKIISIDILRDGGTIVVETDEGDYYIDGRINSRTKGKIFWGYPMLDNSNIVLNDRTLAIRLRDSLRNFYPKKFENLVFQVIDQLELSI